jgi:hypothetical protein
LTGRWPGISSFGLLSEAGFSELALPKKIFFLPELPKLGTGKIDYVRLR